MDSTFKGDPHPDPKCFEPKFEKKMLIFSLRDEYINVGGFLDKEEKEVLPYPFFLAPYLEPSKLTLSC